MFKLKKLILWGFVIIWMGSILAFSSQPADVSKKQSSYFVSIAQKFIVGFERKFNIKLLDFSHLDTLVRKTAHIFNYCLLTILLIYAYLSIHLSTKQSLLHSFQSSLLFSILDELYQTFVPGRSGMFGDILIDQIGTIIALFLVFLVMRKFTIIKRKMNTF